MQAQKQFLEIQVYSDIGDNRKNESQFKKQEN